jgi:hypothetical protein
MGKPYPPLYQINTRVWLTELAQRLGRPATLDEIPDAALGGLARMGFDWVWFLSVWQTGSAGNGCHAATPSGETSLRRPCRTCGKRISPVRVLRSPAIRCTTTLAGTPRWPGCASASPARPAAMLDFVPNHTALDHPGWKITPAITCVARSWTWPGHPRNYNWAKRKQGDLLLAYGRDPYLPGWPNTLQLNYGNPATQEAMIGELIKGRARTPAPFNERNLAEVP